MNEQDARDISSLIISTRVENTLKANAISTVGALRRAMRDRKVGKISGLGRKSIAEIGDALERADLAPLGTTVADAAALFSRLLAEGKGELPVQIMEIDGGVTFAREVRIHEAADHDGERVWVRPEGQRLDPEWMR